MGQSLAARFNGNKDEVLAYTKMYGDGRAMDRFGVKDFVAWRRWILKETGNANYGVSPEIGFRNAQNLDTGIVERFADYVLRTKALLDTKDERIMYLENICQTYEKRNYDLALPVLKMLEVVRT